MKQFLHFWELKGSYLLVKNSFWERIIKNKKKFSNITNIKNYLKQYNSKKGFQYIPLNKLLYLIKISNFDITLIEKNNLVKGIKSGETGKPIFNLKFPLDFISEEWASVIGGLLSEGYVSNRKGISFWNKNYKMVYKFNKFMNIILKTTSKIGWREDVDAYYIRYPQIVAEILIVGLGFKTGKKIINNPEIPELYKNLDCYDEKNKLFIGRLLSWLFSGDGGIYLFRDCNNRIQRGIEIGFSGPYENKPSKLLEDTYSLLKKMGIKPQMMVQKRNKKRKEFYGYHWRFFIKGKENFELFKKYVNFEQIEKRKILNKAIKSYIKPNLKKVKLYLR